MIARFADTPDPRLLEVLAGLVQHLHTFAREVKLTEEEWAKGIEFLTSTGQKHIVMWTVRGDSAEERHANAIRLRAAFETLRGCIPGLLQLELGIDQSRADYACAVVLYTEFASQEALDAYAVHPEHLRVKGEVGDVRTSRHQVDYMSGDCLASS